MTLGRTSDNKIKIKTDSPKGLRAVECACCASLVCGCIYVPADLKPIIESATQVSVNGISQPWNSSSAAYNGNPPIDYTLWAVTYSGGILCASIDNSLNSTKFAPEPFTAEECWFFGAVITQNGSINGQSVRVAQAFDSPSLSLDVVFS